MTRRQPLGPIDRVPPSPVIAVTRYGRISDAVVGDRRRDERHLERRHERLALAVGGVRQLDVVLRTRRAPSRRRRSPARPPSAGRRAAARRSPCASRTRSSASPPVATPVSAYQMLHDASVAPIEVQRPRARSAGGGRRWTRNPSMTRPSSSAGAAPRTSCRGSTAPEPRPAIAVTILNTEPGTYRPSVARGRSGSAGSSRSASKVALGRRRVGDRRSRRRYGFEAIARTSPVRGSSMTTAPRCLPSAAAAARWRS